MVQRSLDEVALSTSPCRPPRRRAPPPPPPSLHLYVSPRSFCRSCVVSHTHTHQLCLLHTPSISNARAVLRARETPQEGQDLAPGSRCRSVWFRALGWGNLGEWGGGKFRFGGWGCHKLRGWGRGKLGPLSIYISPSPRSFCLSCSPTHTHTHNLSASHSLYLQRSCCPARVSNPSRRARPGARPLSPVCRVSGIRLGELGGWDEYQSRSGLGILLNLGV